MKKARIIVISGQSNAVGVGHVKCLAKHFPQELVEKWEKGFPNIKINYFSHDKKSGGFVPTTTGCTEVSKYTIGPEVGIAEALDRRCPGEEFFIVKCAFGGMSLHTDFISPSGENYYDPDAYADQKANILADYFNGDPIRPGWCYNELVKIMRESIVALEAEGYAPEIVSFCWMQGEGDSITQDQLDNYIRRYDAMLADFNREFAPYIAENCTYTDAGISTIWPLWEGMNKAKKEYSETKPCLRFIDTVGEGLTTANEPPEEPDIYHYDSDSMIKLGLLYAAEIPV